MNTQRIEIMNSANAEYLLLFRGTQYDGLSPEEMQIAAGKFMAWFERLKAEGKCKGGQPLQATGRVVSGKGGRTVADGPFAESKEAIGGYFALTVSGMEEAVAIAKGCPALEHGMTVEVRPVAEECPALRASREELAHAAA
jgi:hypothetical protein